MSSRVHKVSQLWLHGGGREAHEKYVHERRMRRLGRKIRQQKAEIDAAVQSTELTALGRKELLALAKKKDVKGRSRMTKKQLVEALI